MLFRRYAVGLVSGVLCACGARVSEQAGTGGAAGVPPTSIAGAGAVSGSAAGSGGRVGSGGDDGTGGAFSIDTPRPSVVDGGTSCEFSSVICGYFDSYVEIQDGASRFRLSYPGDDGCGRCGSSGCDLYAQANSACGGIDVRFSVCAGPGGRPPCLDTGDPSSYVDPTGRRWRLADVVAASLPSGPAPSGPLIDLDAILRYGDSAETLRELPVHVHLCGNVVRRLLPC